MTQIHACRLNQSQLSGLVSLELEKRVQDLGGDWNGIGAVCNVLMMVQRWSSVHLENHTATGRDGRVRVLGDDVDAGQPKTEDRRCCGDLTLE